MYSLASYVPCMKRPVWTIWPWPMCHNPDHWPRPSALPGFSHGCASMMQASSALAVTFSVGASRVLCPLCVHLFHCLEGYMYDVHYVENRKYSIIIIREGTDDTGMRRPLHGTYRRIQEPLRGHIGWGHIVIVPATTACAPWNASPQ